MGCHPRNCVRTICQMLFVCPQQRSRIKMYETVIFAGCSAIPQPPPRVLAWRRLPAPRTYADINCRFHFFIDLQYKSISDLILLRRSLKLEVGRISSVWFLLFKSVRGEYLQLVGCDHLLLKENHRFSQQWTVCYPAQNVYLLKYRVTQWPSFF